MADVFLSYSRDDANRIRPFVRTLELRGLSVFWDHTITPGDNWNAVLEREISIAKAVVVVWSSNSVGSRWVQAEASRADSAGKLVPMRIDDATPPMPFGMVQTFNLANGISGPAPEQLAQFHDRLGILIGRGIAAPKRGWFGLSGPSSASYVATDGTILYAGIAPRLFALFIDYVVAGVLLFALIALISGLIPGSFAKTRLSLPFGLMQSDKTLETMTTEQPGPDGTPIKTTDRVVERTVAGTWVYLLRIVGTETKVKPGTADYEELNKNLRKGEKPKDTKTTSRIIRLDPATREPVPDHDLFVWTFAWLLIYSALMEATPLRATVGKKLIGLHVVDMSGRRCRLHRTILRNAVKAVFPGFYLVGRTRRSQALHDLVAGTLVMQKAI